MTLIRKTEHEVEHNPFSICVSLPLNSERPLKPLYDALEKFLNGNSEGKGPHFVLNIQFQQRMQFYPTGVPHTYLLVDENDPGKVSVVDHLVVSGNLPAAIAASYAAAKSAVEELAEVIAMAVSSYQVEITMHGKVVTFGVSRADATAA